MSHTRADLCQRSCDRRRISLPPLPAALLPIVIPFAPVFSVWVWRPAQVWRLGTMRAPGVRPVTTTWRVRGLSAARRVTNDQRVLSRAAWSARPWRQGGSIPVLGTAWDHNAELTFAACWAWGHSHRWYPC
jgi:hypothetical protein